MNGPMALACHTGSKTQTRRMVKMQPQGVDVTHNNDKSIWFGWDHGIVGDELRCPFGVPGNRLWVRETFVEIAGRAWHRAGGNLHFDGKPYTGRWTPSIHMPRWACRTVLEITDVRVERLQAITEAEAVAEGVQRDTEPCDHIRQSCDEVGCLGPTHRAAFATLWDSLPGVRWTANPWVWVVSFKKGE